MKYLFYRFVRFTGRGIVKLVYRPKYIGRSNVPSDGPVILAGNHTNNRDALLMIGGPRRIVHTLAKKELFNNWFTKLFFKGMACIPVDRNIHDDSAKNEAVNVLKNGGCIGIFPEGTTNKTIGTKDEVDLLPFKYGAASFAQKTGAYIVPFAITGKYKVFKKGIRIEYGEPYKIKSKDLDRENKILTEKVRTLKGKMKNGN